MRDRKHPHLPSTDDVRSRLLLLSFGEVRSLCDETGAPFTTVWKVRAGETANPGLETVRSFWPALLRVTEGREALPADAGEATCHG